MPCPLTRAAFGRKRAAGWHGCSAGSNATRSAQKASAAKTGCVTTCVTAAASSPRCPGFRVFRLNGASAAEPRETSRADAAAKPYGHVPFKADPLLSLGVARPSTPRTAPTAQLTARARNPLDRWVRPCRQDPDWRPPEDNDRGYSLVRNAAIAPAPRAPTIKAATSPAQKRMPWLAPSLFDWRRRYDAWTQPVPAPDLAARLDALAHVVSNPAAIIANAARRLHRSATPASPLMRCAPPAARPPRRAAHIETLSDASDLARRCHAHLPAPDTS